jgi:fucose 4-O-acetylase-like acetyltransferase
MNLNFLKGLLIILVVVDHNEFTRSLFRDFFLGLSFHVIGFMAIPFLKPAANWRAPDFGAYIFRLYYPFLLVTCCLWVVVTVTGAAPLAERAHLLWLSLYSGNATVLKQATQMGLLWFLPSFIAIVVLRAVIEGGTQRFKLIAIAVVLAMHPCIGLVARSVENYLPLGLLPALYIIPLAYAAVALHRTLLARLPVAAAIAVAALAYVLVKAIQMRMGLYYEVGFAVVADLRSPLALLVNDLEGICGTLMLFQCARIDVRGMIESCGRNSMQLYLFHAFVALAVYKLLLRFAGHWPVAVLFAVSVTATVVFTLLLATLVMRTALLRRAIFPRSPADLALSRA